MDKRGKTFNRLGLLLLILTACPALLYLAFPLPGDALRRLDLQPAFLSVPAIVFFMLSAVMLPKGNGRPYSWRTRLMSLSFISITCYYIVWVFYLMGRVGSLTVFLLGLFPVLSMLFAAFDRRSTASAVLSILSGILLIISMII